MLLHVAFGAFDNSAFQCRLRRFLIQERNRANSLLDAAEAGNNRHVEIMPQRLLDFLYVFRHALQRGRRRVIERKQKRVAVFRNADRLAERLPVEHLRHAIERLFDERRTGNGLIPLADMLELLDADGSHAKPGIWPMQAEWRGGGEQIGRGLACNQITQEAAALIFLLKQRIAV